MRELFRIIPKFQRDNRDVVIARRGNFLFDRLCKLLCNPGAVCVKIYAANRLLKRLFGVIEHPVGGKHHQIARLQSARTAPETHLAQNTDRQCRAFDFHTFLFAA